MAQQTTIRLNDYGWVLRLTVTESGAAVDVSTITLTDALVLVPPRGAIKRYTMGFLNTGTDGIVQYQVDDGAFDEVGRWSVYVRVDTGSLDVKAGPFFVDVDRA